MDQRITEEIRQQITRLQFKQNYINIYINCKWSEHILFTTWIKK